jgi:hypothetical protein
MKAYSAAFVSLFNDLTNNDAIRIDDFQCAEGCAPELIAKVEHDFRLSLPEAVKQFYTECNGVSLKWAADRPEDTEEPVAGRIRLLDLEKVFSGPDRARWENDIWRSNMPEDEKRMRMNLKPFDYFDPDDSGCCCFDLSQPDISVDLVLHSVDYGLNSISVNFTQYLDLLLKTRGLVRWQYLFSGRKNLANYSVHEQAVRRNLEALFKERV